MVGLCGIAGRRAYAAILLGNQLFVAERFVGRIAPELPAHALVQTLGECLGKAVGQRLRQDGRIIVIGTLESLGDVLLPEARGDDESADIVRDSARTRGDEIRERAIGATLA